MSRIFDALQRSGLEQTGVEYPDMVSVANEVFEAPPTKHSDIPALREEAVAPPIPAIGVPASGCGESMPDFPSIEARTTAESRLVFFSAPDSLAAEKFRFLGVRLRQVRQSRPLKKVLVTSTIPEEGKSLVSANLAGVLARRKEKVLLIEGDLRRPTLADQFGLGRLAGLSEWLQSGQQKLSNIYHFGDPGFWLMPAGGPPSNPLELMQSGRLSVLMAQLTNLFDWIVVDSPPVLPLADTTVWSRLTEGTLLVAREGTTKKSALQQGLEAIKKNELLGVVLNGCSDRNNHNYYQRYAPPDSNKQ